MTYQKTLAYYNINANDFAENTVNANIEEIQDKFINLIPRHAYILDFGCGSGRDTKIFLEKGYQELPRKIEWLEKKDLWDELRDYYIYKKNKNTNPDKKSRAIFTETVNEMCQKNGYKSKKN